MLVHVIKTKNMSSRWGLVANHADKEGKEIRGYMGKAAVMVLQVYLKGVSVRIRATEV